MSLMLHHRNVVDAARAAGVRHTLYNSVIEPIALAAFLRKALAPK